MKHIPFYLQIGLSLILFSCSGDDSPQVNEQGPNSTAKSLRIRKGDNSLVNITSVYIFINGSLEPANLDAKGEATESAIVHIDDVVRFQCRIRPNLTIGDDNPETTNQVCIEYRLETSTSTEWSSDLCCTNYSNNPNTWYFGEPITIN